jgi:hypothetical protein
MSYFQDYFSIITDVLFVGPLGWAITAILVGILGYLFLELRKIFNQDKYSASIAWVFLEVRVDELNEKSPLAMEQIFAALHAVHQNFSWGERQAGKSVLSVSCEIVSLGGKVSYIFRVPERFRNLLESAIFAQYPKAEVAQVEDYLGRLPHSYDPKTAEFDFWGTQWHKKKDNAYPIRTYAEEASFEHAAQKTFVDPLANVLEVMSNLQPYELMAYQLVIKPVNDDWKLHTKHLLDELKGVPHKHSTGTFEKIVYFIPSLIADFLVAAIGATAGEDAGPSHAPAEPPSQMMHKSDVEKFVISSVERAMGKITYEVRMRTLYLAPKDKINKSLRIPEIVGALRNFDDVNLNGLKPDLGHTWTEAPSYKISETLERPYLEYAKLVRRRHFWHNFLPRSSWRGSGKVIMNTEELATIFHFPQVPNARVSQLERVSAVKAAPPMDLPIG